MGYGPIKADRSLIGWLLLSLVTCGIYSFYFPVLLGTRRQHVVSG